MGFLLHEAGYVLVFETSPNQAQLIGDGDGFGQHGLIRVFVLWGDNWGQRRAKWGEIVGDSGVLGATHLVTLLIENPNRRS